jgi:hypothetical protein
MAIALRMSEHMVRHHVRRLRGKLRVRHRAQLPLAVGKALRASGNGANPPSIALPGSITRSGDRQGPDAY